MYFVPPSDRRFQITDLNGRELGREATRMGALFIAEVNRVFHDRHCFVWDKETGEVIFETKNAPPPTAHYEGAETGHLDLPSDGNARR